MADRTPIYSVSFHIRELCIGDMEGGRVNLGMALSPPRRQLTSTTQEEVYDKRAIAMAMGTERPGGDFR
ncbi:MAG: hypothetical protein OWT28_03995 [Firmicutes bacterium]|nr:hypothetical protein [Bacillota bacterium]